MKTLSSVLFLALMFASLTARAGAAPPSISRQPWGTVDGKSVFLYTLTNTRGMRAQITNYGGIIVSLLVPDKSGRLGDVVLGYDNLRQYIANSPYFGAIVGRYANRIARGRFVLDGKTYHLYINNPPNSLHGGKKGFDKVVWTPTPIRRAGGVGLALHYLSPDGQEDYPGDLSVNVTYTLQNDNALRIDYRATTDKDTVINLSNHAYYNLDGQGNGTILDHRVMIPADSFTPIDKTLIPTGKIQSVAGTPLDFRTPRTIGSRIDSKYPQIVYAGGYDFNYILRQPGHKMVLAARVWGPKSGRVLTIYTTEPGLQFYSGNFLDGTNIGKGGKPYLKHYAFAMETQHFPDSPNHPNFPTTELRPGQVFRESAIYKFTVAK